MTWTEMGLQQSIAVLSNGFSSAAETGKPSPES